MIVVLEAIKLLEAGTMAGLCDENLGSGRQPGSTGARALENRGMPEARRRRMDMQSPQAAKVNQADRVIDNNGTLADALCTAGSHLLICRLSLRPD